MSDLISRWDAINAMMALKQEDDERYGCEIPEGFDGQRAVEALEKLPSAEPERKIIYCKDCKFAHLTTEGEVKYCDVWFPETKTYLSADDFCSSAEKRGDR